MAMRILVFADRRFLRQAMHEAAAKLGARSMSRVSERSFTAETEGTPASERLVFIESLAVVSAVMPAAAGDADLVSAIEGCIDKSKTFRIEVVNDNLHAGENAKSTEVRLGRILEGRGFKADLASPAETVVIERTSGTTIVGRRTAGSPWQANPFRGASNRQRINRSAYKLDEALDYFAIDRRGIRSALDVGSAPGGWALLLSGFSKVVAIDPAPLDYGKLEGKRVLVVAREDEGKLSNIRERFPQVAVADHVPDDKGFDVLHVMAKAEDSLPYLKGMEFDLLAMDANATVKDCAALATMLLGTLKAGAEAVITLKLFRNDPVKETAAAERLLAGFTSFEAKKLPHDRDEVTLHARKA